MRAVFRRSAFNGVAGEGARLARRPRFEDESASSHGRSCHPPCCAAIAKMTMRFCPQSPQVVLDRASNSPLGKRPPAPFNRRCDEDHGCEAHLWGYMSFCRTALIFSLIAASSRSRARADSGVSM
jgi:hypothetical protein